MLLKGYHRWIRWKCCKLILANLKLILWPGNPLLFSTLETWRELVQVKIPKDLWDCYWLQRSLCKSYLFPGLLVFKVGNRNPWNNLAESSDKSRSSFLQAYSRLFLVVESNSCHVCVSKNMNAVHLPTLLRTRWFTFTQEVPVNESKSCLFFS